MNLEDALEELDGLKPMYRTGWDPQDGYIFSMPGMDHIWKIVLIPAPNAGNYIFSKKDLRATDWELYTHPRSPVESEVSEIEA